MYLGTLCPAWDGYNHLSTHTHLYISLPLPPSPALAHFAAELDECNTLKKALSCHMPRYLDHLLYTSISQAHPSPESPHGA